MCVDCSPSKPKRARAKALADLPAPVGSCFDAAKAELSAAGALESTMGQTALRLAARIDSGEDTGAGLAALARQLQSCMTQIAAPAAELDPLEKLLARDELSERRERRSG